MPANMQGKSRFELRLPNEDKMAIAREAIRRKMPRHQLILDLLAPHLRKLKSMHGRNRDGDS